LAGNYTVSVKTTEFYFLAVTSGQTMLERFFNYV